MGFEEYIPQKRLHTGAKRLVSRCHCGKIRANHTISEAKLCLKNAETKTVVKQFTEQDIQNMQPSKI